MIIKILCSSYLWMRVKVILMCSDEKVIYLVPFLLNETALPSQYSLLLSIPFCLFLLSHYWLTTSWTVTLPLFGVCACIYLSAKRAVHYSWLTSDVGDSKETFTVSAVQLANISTVSVHKFGFWSISFPYLPLLFGHNFTLCHEKN